MVNILHFFPLFQQIYIRVILKIFSVIVNYINKKKTREIFKWRYSKKITFQSFTEIRICFWAGRGKLLKPIDFVFRKHQDKVYMHKKINFSKFARATKMWFFGISSNKISNLSTSKSKMIKILWRLAIQWQFKVKDARHCAFSWEKEKMSRNVQKSTFFYNLKIFITISKFLKL